MLEERVKKLEQEKKALEEKLLLMKELSSSMGFYGVYCSRVSKYSTRKACFDALNDEYFELFGQYKYSCFNTFQVIINRLIKS